MTPFELPDPAPSAGPFQPVEAAAVRGSARALYRWLYRFDGQTGLRT